ncbi:MAG: phosphate regulon sensor histidine kinase PhoR [Thiohalophilus sp.]|jgi:two-component system phosphate regulon sensor histidine kinase PhoR
MPYNWTSEFWRILTSLLLAGTFGWVTGYVLPAILLVVSLWFISYFIRLKKLHHWLIIERKQEPPYAAGLWGEVYTGIYRLQQRARKRNKRLVKAINRFRETTSALPDGVVALRAEGEIEWWNAEAGRLLQLKFPQDVGLRLSNLLRHPDVAAYWRGEWPEEQVTIQSPYNDMVRLNIRMVKYGQDQALVIVRDVTLFEQVEQMRRDFVANISHELRTPLTVLSGYLENLIDDQAEAEDEQHRKTLKVMYQQTKRMHQLIEDLMLLSNFENEARSRKEDIVNVPHMLASLKEQAEILSGERNHTILLEVDSTLDLAGETRELDSIFTNLVVNAVNYTPSGGAIRIRWYEDDKGAHFEVHDTGIGIPPHHVPRLTERFYRVDVGRSRDTGGSGLGLAIVKHAMQRNRGSLRIDSEVGRGSTFICDFPSELIRRRSQQALPANA